MATPPPPPTQLGELILLRTPYQSMTLPTGWQNEIEWDAHYVEWSFRGVNRRVAKALRIPVTVTVLNETTQQPETYRDWLLIGYEGGSGE
jgi:hypothetical protein